jgi:hypothetical protein
LRRTVERAAEIVGMTWREAEAIAGKNLPILLHGGPVV